MIAVDTSAIVAILRGEANEPRLRLALENTNGAAMSVGNLLELQIVLAGRDELPAWNQAEALLAKYEIATRPFDARQLQFAREAAIRFGKGHHGAKLNFGDCFAYALAKSEDIPLLCTGTDFSLTDVAIA